MRGDVAGLHPERFPQAWQATLDRHDTLRTGFLWQGELPAPIQVVYKQVRLDFTEHDWRGRPHPQEALHALVVRLPSLQRCGDVQWKTATFFRGAHCLPVTWS